MGKIKVLQSYMKKKNINLSLLFNFESLKPTPNYHYLTGFMGQGIFVLTQTGKPTLLVPTPEYPIAKYELKDRFKIIKYEKSLVGILNSKFSRQLKGRIGMDYISLKVVQLKQLRKVLKLKSIVDIGSEVVKSRSIKTPEEIKKIRIACSLCDKILKKTILKIRNFKRESEVAADLVHETYKAGLKLSFEPIVASGKNSGKWHHVTTTDKITRGFLIIDFGVKYEGYCSDVTRTVFVGKPTKKEILEYNKILTIQKDCISMIAPGVDYRDIHNYAAKKLGKYFNHGIGHGVGLNEHESPFVHEGKLAEGMALTIEPGIYYPYKFGIRIEDDVLVTKDGHEVFTKVDNKFKVI